MLHKLVFLLFAASIISSLNVYNPTIHAPKIPSIFSTVVRPWKFGAFIKHNLASWMFANLTDPTRPLIAELSIPYNTTDPPFYFITFIDSLHGFNYFIDVTVYTKSPQNFPYPPWIITSLMIANLINEFNSNSNPTFIQHYDKCPGYNEGIKFKQCDLWTVKITSGDTLYVYVNGTTLLRISINRAETFTFDLDSFRDDNPFNWNDYKPGNFVKCKPPFY